MDEFNELAELKNERSELKSDTGGNASQEDNDPNEVLFAYCC